MKDLVKLVGAPPLNAVEAADVDPVNAKSASVVAQEAAAPLGPQSGFASIVRSEVPNTIGRARGTQFTRQVQAFREAVTFTPGLAIALLQALESGDEDRDIPRMLASISGDIINAQRSGELSLSSFSLAASIRLFRMPMIKAFEIFTERLSAAKREVDLSLLKWAAAPDSEPDSANYHLSALKLLKPNLATHLVEAISARLGANDTTVKEGTLLMRAAALACPGHAPLAQAVLPYLALSKGEESNAAASRYLSESTRSESFGVEARNLFERVLKIVDEQKGTAPSSVLEQLFLLLPLLDVGAKSRRRAEDVLAVFLFHQHPRAAEAAVAAYRMGSCTDPIAKETRALLKKGALGHDSQSLIAQALCETRKGSPEVVKLLRDLAIRGGHAGETAVRALRELGVSFNATQRALYSWFGG